MSPTFYQSAIKNVDFGIDVKVVEPVNIYGCSIGDQCFIGPFVEIQKDVKIGKRTKVQSQTFVCELVSIVDDCFIGHRIMFINDLFQKGRPAQGDRSLWMSTKIGNQVSVGSNATILPVDICDQVVIGAGATKNITQAGVYAGNPAKLIKVL